MLDRTHVGMTFERAEGRGPRFCRYCDRCESAGQQHREKRGAGVHFHPRKCPLISAQTSDMISYWITFSNSLIDRGASASPSAVSCFPLSSQRRRVFLPLPFSYSLEMPSSS